MTAPLHTIPLDAIAADALTRDRTRPDPAALEELRASILATGLRMPIEVYRLPTPDDGRRFGLISGFRRLAAFRALRDEVFDGTRFTEIPAFVREPRDVTEALTAMVEENCIRAEVSPWEQALVAVTARNLAVFDTVDAAIDALYANLNRDKRRRLRTIAHLAEELEGTLTAPETWPAPAPPPPRRRHLPRLRRPHPPRPDRDHRPRRRQPVAHPPADPRRGRAPRHPRPLL